MNDTEDESQRESVDVDAAVESVDDGEWKQIHQAFYDRDGDEELATALIYAIADAKGVDPLDGTEMPPLYEAVDAEALEETFFGPSGSDASREESGTVVFLYDGYKVVLRSDGWISVYEPR